MTLVLGALFLLLFAGAPIGVALGAPAVLYLLQNDIPLTILTQRLTQTLNSFPLLAIPLFILAGRLMNEGGITRRIFRFANNLVGAIPGGLGHVNVLASMIFAGMSGVAIADIGGLGQIEVKAMKEARYPDRFIAGITAASAIVGPVIPPSIPIILFSVASEASVIALFAGGIAPGVLIGLLLMATVWIWSLRGALPRSPRPPLREVGTSLLAALPALFAPVLLIGGMLSGVFSPTEAAGVTVLYSLLLTLVVYRELPLRSLPGVIRDLVPVVANLSFIIASALLFAWVLVIEQVPQTLVGLLLGLSDNKWLLLGLVVIFFLLIGCIMEASIVFLVVAPMVLPAMQTLGISEVHFGIVTVVAMGIGMYTPPVGIALYMIQELCGISFEEAVKSVAPFIVTLLLALALLTFVPEIVTWLPERLGLVY
jgi:tripartite ATP-independent transporter DctM subunit